MNAFVAPRVTRAAEGLPRRQFTVAEVEAMVEAGILDDDERVELIGGELVPMSPKGCRHELVKSFLVDRWIRLRPSSVRLTQETTFRLSDDTYLEPDVVSSTRASPGCWRSRPPTCCWSSKSPNSSRRYDMGRKARPYAGFGIRELWVIDAVKMTTGVFRAPSEHGYCEKRDFRASDRLVPLFAPPAKRSCPM